MSAPTQGFTGWNGQQSGQQQNGQGQQGGWAGQAQPNGQPAPAPASAAPSASDLLMGQSRKGRSASFPAIGSQFAGTICGAPEVVQQRDPETGDPKFYRNSTDPIWQIVLPCQTDLRDAVNVGPDDDGVRYLYIGGSRKPESRSMHVAVAQAVRAAGATELEVGGFIEVAYVADGPKSPNAPAVAKPPKQYQARYTRPTSQASQMLGLGGSETGGNAPAQQPPAVDPWAQQAAPVQQPVQQIPAQTAPQQAPAAPAQVQDQTGADPRLLAAIAHLTVEQQNALVAAGITAEQAEVMYPRG